MALIKTGGGVSAISGKISGTVFARNRSGAYARNWGKPLNPGAARQTDVRSNFAAASAEYSMLSAAAVASWEAYAALQTRKNRQGDTYVPSGRQVFMECFINAMTIPTSPLLAPTAISNVPALTGLGAVTLSVTSNHINVFSLASATATIPSSGDGVIVVEAAPFHKPSVTNVNKQFRQILTAATIDGPFDLKAAYTAIFGDTLHVGQIGNLRVRVIDDGSMLGSTFMLTSKTAV